MELSGIFALNDLGVSIWHPLSADTYWRMEVGQVYRAGG